MHSPSLARLVRFARLGWLMDRVPYAHADATRKSLPEASIILDVGGGTGRVAHRLRGKRVIVVDVEPHMIARAKKRGLEAVLADAGHLPFRSAAPVAILLVDAFHHLPDQMGALAEFRRILPVDGTLVMEEFDPASPTGAMIRLGEALLGFGSSFHRPEALRALAEGAGFAASARRRTRRDYALVAKRR